MKNIFPFILLLLTVILGSQNTNAQEFKGIDKSPMDAAAFPSSFRDSEKVIKIVYSRPQLKGRSLEKLAPTGKVWRTGANEATEVTFYKDVVFGDVNVKAGTYTLFTVPGVKNWTVILSSQTNVWGAYFYKKEFDVARVSIPVKKVEKPIEAFSIAIDDDMTIHLGWATTVVSVPVK